MQEYSIGELSELSGVSVKTIRFYTERGLLTPTRIAASGYRYYSDGELSRLHQIVSLRWIGAPIRHIQELMAGQISLSDVLAAGRAFISAEQDRLERIESRLIEAEETLEGGEEAVWSHLYQLQKLTLVSPEDRELWIKQWWERHVNRESQRPEVDEFVDHARAMASDATPTPVATLIRSLVLTGSQGGHSVDLSSLPNTPRAAGLTTDVSWSDWKRRVQEASQTLREVHTSHPEGAVYQDALRQWMKCFGPLTQASVTSFYNELERALNTSKPLNSDAVPDEIHALRTGLRYLTLMLSRS